MKSNRISLQSASGLGINMKNEVKKYLSKIGARGGSAGKGASKARSSVLARRAANARWKSKVLHNNVSTSAVLPGSLQVSPSPRHSKQKLKPNAAGKNQAG